MLVLHYVAREGKRGKIHLATTDAVQHGENILMPGKDGLTLLFLVLLIA